MTPRRHGYVSLQDNSGFRTLGSGNSLLGRHELLARGHLIDAICFALAGFFATEILSRLLLARLAALLGMTLRLPPSLASPTKPESIS